MAVTDLDLIVSRDVLTEVTILNTDAEESYFVWSIHMVVVVTLALKDMIVIQVIYVHFLLFLHGSIC